MQAILTVRNFPELIQLWTKQNTYESFQLSSYAYKSIDDSSMLYHLRVGKVTTSQLPTARPVTNVFALTMPGLEDL